MKTVRIVRDSRTGRFVRTEEAVRRPNTTETERIKRPSTKK